MFSSQQVQSHTSNVLSTPHICSSTLRELVSELIECGSIEDGQPSLHGSCILCRRQFSVIETSPRLSSHLLSGACPRCLVLISCDTKLLSKVKAESMTYAYRCTNLSCTSPVVLESLIQSSSNPSTYCSACELQRKAIRSASHTARLALQNSQLLVSVSSPTSRSGQSDSSVFFQQFRILPATSQQPPSTPSITAFLQPANEITVRLHTAVCNRIMFGSDEDGLVGLHGICILCQAYWCLPKNDGHALFHLDKGCCQRCATLSTRDTSHREQLKQKNMLFAFRCSNLVCATSVFHPFVIGKGADYDHTLLYCKSCIELLVVSREEAQSAKRLKMASDQD